MLIEARASSAAASSFDPVRFKDFAKFTAKSPSRTRGCSTGGRPEREVLAFTRVAYGTRTRLTARNITRILFICYSFSTDLPLDI
jgi:hypothetical protein